MGNRKPNLAQGGYVCWGRCWVSVIRNLAKLYWKCLTLVTKYLGMLLLSFCFGGLGFAQGHQTFFGGMVVKCFRLACFELQRMLFPVRKSGGVPVLSGLGRVGLNESCPFRGCRRG